MKLKTETGEMLSLDESKENWISEDIKSDVAFTVSEAEELLEKGTLEMVAEDSEVNTDASITEGENPFAKKSKMDDEEEEDEVEEETQDYDEAEEDEDDEVEESDTKAKKATKEEVELEIDVQEDVDALFTGQDLSEDFKARTTLVFETAVKAKVKANLAAIEEKMEAKVTEDTNAILEDVTAKLDSYLDYMVNEWVKDNKVAVENGLKNEILEGFVDGLQTLFAENYIEIPEEKHNILDEQAAEIESLKVRVDEEINKNVEARDALNVKTAEKIFSDISEDLTATQTEKLASLSDEVMFESAEDYSEKLSTLKETYFPSEAKKDEVITESADVLAENVSDSKDEMSDSMKRIVATLSSSKETSILGA